MKLRKNSQVVRLLVELVRGREISRLPALTRLKVQNFQARVSDIKKLEVLPGVHPCLNMEPRATKTGRTYTAYTISCNICKTEIGKALNATKRQRSRRAR